MLIPNIHARFYLRYKYCSYTIVVDNYGARRNARQKHHQLPLELHMMVIVATVVVG